MEYGIENGGITVGLPLTVSQGKVRVKRLCLGFAAEQIFVRSRQMEKDDYLEWQIRYDSELTPLMAEARRLNLLSHSALNEMRKIADTPLEIGGVEEREKFGWKLAPRKSGGVLPSEYGFERFEQSIPSYRKNAEKYGVEIRLGEKQIAVGKQAMVYVNLPLSHCKAQNGRAFAGRIAKANEKAKYQIDKSNLSLFRDMIIAFAFASTKHRRDMRIILQQLQ